MNLAQTPGLQSQNYFQNTHFSPDLRHFLLLKLATLSANVFMKDTQPTAYILVMSCHV
jgi:hypothetical protein